MKQAMTILYFVTALISGYWEFSLMVRPLIGGPLSLWYPITLAASIALLAGAILTLASRAKSARLVVLAASLILALWWIPASAHTLRVYFAPEPKTTSPGELLWALTPAVLVIVSLAVFVTDATNPQSLNQ